MTIAVKRYTSAMTGSPTNNGVAGSLPTLLTKCLVDGFNETSPSGASQTSGTATLTFGSAHGYAVNDVIVLSGANESVWNHEFRVLTVPDSNSLTFAISSGSTTPATGTLSCKIAPLGWTKPFSGTDKAVFLPKVQYVQCYLRVLDDSSTPTSASGRWAKVRGYETMSDVDTGSGPFPDAAQSTNGLTFFKSSTSDSTARPWWLVGDGGIFYFGSFAHASYLTTASVHAFGDINSLKSGDAYSSFICGGTSDTLPSQPGSTHLFGTLGAYNVTQNGKYLARTYTQLGTAIACGMVGDNTISTSAGESGLTYPHPPDSGLLIATIAVMENSIVRSRAMPGLYYPLHAAPLSHLAVVSDIPDLPGRVLQAFTACPRTNVVGQLLFDITGPWR